MITARALRRAATTRSARRAAWGLVDQAVSSLTNFGVVVLVASRAEPRQFGRFSLALALCLFLLWVSRSLCTEPFVIRFTTAPPAARTVAAAQATGATLVLGLFAGFLVLCVGFVAEPAPPRIFAAMALAMPGLFVQDAFRYVLFAAGRARSAAVNDAAWGGVALGSALLLVISGKETTALLTGCFGAGAAVAAVIGSWQAGVVPSPRASLPWLRRNRDLAMPFALEMMAVSGAVQIAMVAIAAVAGVAAVGEFRAATLLLGPLTVLFLGIFVIGTPEAVRLRERSHRSLVMMTIALGIAMPLVTVAWAGLIALLSADVGRSLLGSSWSPARRLLVPVAVYTAAMSCTLAAAIGLRALGAARRSLKARLVGVPAILVGAVLGAGMDGARGAAIGLALASTFDAALTWVAFGRALSGACQPSESASVLMDSTGGMWPASLGGEALVCGVIETTPSPETRDVVTPVISVLIGGRARLSAMRIRLDPRRHPCPPIVTLLDAFGSQEGAPEVLLFGDSVLHRVSRDDRQREGLATLLSQAFRPIEVCTVAGDGYHPELYRSLVNVLATAPGRPRLVILPINLRSFLPPWTMNPKWRLDHIVRAAETYVSNPTSGTPSVRVNPTPKRHEQRRYLEADVNYLGHQGAKVSDFVTRISQERAGASAETERRQAIFTFHYMYEIDENNPTLAALRTAAATISAQGCTLFTYFTPVNYEAGCRLLGPRFSETIKRNVSSVAAALTAEPGGHGMASPQDWSMLLPARSFFHDFEPSEHLNASGRAQLCRSVVDHALPLLGKNVPLVADLGE